MEGLTKFGQLEAALARHHRIDDDKRTQFQARLRKFQRMGIGKPDSADGARSKAGRFEPLEVVEMALALEFTALGMSPEQVKRSLAESRASAALGLGRIMKDRVRAFKPNNDKPARPVYLILDPNTLEDLQISETDRYYRDKSIGVYSTHRDPEILLGMLARSPRCGIINLSQMIAALERCFLGIGLEPAYRWIFEASKKAYAEEVGLRLDRTMFSAVSSPHVAYEEVDDATFNSDRWFKDAITDIEPALRDGVTMERDGDYAILSLPFGRRLILDIEDRCEATVECLVKRLEKMLDRYGDAEHPTALAACFRERPDNFELDMQLADAGMEFAAGTGNPNLRTGPLSFWRAFFLTRRLAALSDGQISYNDIFGTDLDHGNDQKA